MKPSWKKKQKTTNEYVKYTAIGTQMAVVIFLGVFGGIELDKQIDTKPLFTIILSLLGFTLGIYQAIKDFINLNKKDDKKQ